MNYFFYRLGFILFFLFTISGFSQSLKGDSETIKISWAELENQKLERGNLSFGKIFYNKNPDQEWTEYKIRLEATNKYPSKIKVRAIIAIYDKSGQLIFSGGDDKGISPMKSEQISFEMKVASTLKFEPDNIVLRLWWDDHRDNKDK